MHNRNIPLGPIRSVSFDVRDEYRKRIEELHPWLHLCRGSWKAEQIWTDIYTDWKPSDPGAGKQRAKREHPIEDDEPGPSSKKLKTPAPEGPETPALEKRARPKPTMRKPAAKVHKLPFLRVYILTKTRPDHSDVSRYRVLALASHADPLLQYGY